MIKCNVTVCGVIGRDASIRTNKEGKTFLVFPLRVMIPDTDGKTMPIEVDVSKDTAGKEVSKYLDKDSTSYAFIEIKAFRGYF